MVAIPVVRTAPHLAVVATLLVVAGHARAQSPSCLRDLPPEIFRTVLVSVVPGERDAAAMASESVVRLFAQTTAEQVRQALGATGDQLPDGAPRLRWHHLKDGVRVVLRRDGRAEVRQQDDHVGAPEDSTAYALLVRAARFAADSTAPYPWDARARGDALAFDLDFEYPRMLTTGTIEPLRTHRGFPVFTLRVPLMSPPRVLERHRVEYPWKSLAGGAAGKVVMRFVVDTSGRADPATVRDAWPVGDPRPTGELGEYYRAFVRSVTRAVERSRFEPARIAGCPVRQLTEMSFEFGLRQ